MGRDGTVHEEAFLPDILSIRMDCSLGHRHRQPKEVILHFIHNIKIEEGLNIL